MGLFFLPRCSVTKYRFLFLNKCNTIKHQSDNSHLAVAYFPKLIVAGCSCHPDIQGMPEVTQCLLRKQKNHNLNWFI